MNKKLLLFKRKKAKELHEKGRSNREIARHLLASKNSVGKWVQMDESEISSDNRGWEMPGKSVTLKVDSAAYDEYRKFCKKKGLIVSRQFEIMMEEQMEGV